MNRRDFIKGSLGVVGVIALAPTIGFAQEIDKTVQVSELRIIEDAIKIILMRYIFEGNDSMTRRAISVDINNYLSGLVSLENYDVICDSQNNSPDDVQNGTIRTIVYLFPKKRPIQITQLNYITDVNGVSVDNVE